jgi:hypothetical protein
MADFFSEAASGGGGGESGDGKRVKGGVEDKEGRLAVDNNGDSVGGDGDSVGGDDGDDGESPSGLSGGFASLMGGSLSLGTVSSFFRSVLEESLLDEELAVVATSEGEGGHALDSAKA